VNDEFDMLRSQITQQYGSAAPPLPDLGALELQAREAVDYWTVTVAVAQQELEKAQAIFDRLSGGPLITAPMGAFVPGTTERETPKEKRRTHSDAAYVQVLNGLAEHSYAIRETISATAKIGTSTVSSVLREAVERGHAMTWKRDSRGPQGGARKAVYKITEAGVEFLTDPTSADRTTNDQ
jgi:DNA-binding PadR family transcriptional regulator